MKKRKRSLRALPLLPRLLLLLQQSGWLPLPHHQLLRNLLQSLHVSRRRHRPSPKLSSRRRRSSRPPSPSLSLPPHLSRSPNPPMVMPNPLHPRLSRTRRKPSRKPSPPNPRLYQYHHRSPLQPLPLLLLYPHLHPSLLQPNRPSLLNRPSRRRGRLWQQVADGALARPQAVFVP